MAQDMRLIRLENRHHAAWFAVTQHHGLPAFICVTSRETKAPDIPVLHAAPASPDIRVPITLMTVDGEGFFGRPSISASVGRVGLLGAPSFEVTEQPSELRIRYLYQSFGLIAHQRIILDNLGTLTFSLSLENAGQHSITVHQAATLTLELSKDFTHILHREGTWAYEGHEQRLPITKSIYEKTARGGRTGFSGAGFLTCVGVDTDEEQGPALGVAVAWSGNSTTLVEGLADGRRQLQAGLLLDSGEGYLDPGDRLDLPDVTLVQSTSGLNGMSKRFHEHARTVAPSIDKRFAQLNSWEAVYFDLNEDVVCALIDEAADLGLERFVLDDGWFAGRRDDTTSLGDWWINKDLFPGGFTPLIAHASSLGLEFGLWLEPEMISPDSHMARAHPDWILGGHSGIPPTGRSQWVLDLTKGDVTDYLFDRISGVLSDNDISYLKWDHNRALYPAANAIGQVARKQTNALYGLLARIRKAHPSVLIEACASGGGRLDYGMLPYVTRYWVSDSTDPVERVSIQSAAFRYFPPEMLGCHIGPSPNPISGRESPIMFRAITAIFGHLGVESDPRALSAADKATIRQAISVFKMLRPSLIGAVYRVIRRTPDLLIDQITGAAGCYVRVISLRPQTIDLSGLSLEEPLLISDGLTVEADSSLIANEALSAVLFRVMP